MYHLEDGAYFGEIALIFDQELRLVTMTAIENSKLYTLTRTDFRNIMRPHPIWYDRICSEIIKNHEKERLPTYIKLLKEDSQP